MLSRGQQGADALTVRSAGRRPFSSRRVALARIGPRYQHSTPAQVAKTAQRAQLPHLLLTHFSQRYRRFRQLSPPTAHTHIPSHTVDDLFAEARRLYSGNLLLAEDLASYELSKEKALLPVPTR